jgi:GNAT superfamily N-acetyltransferase
MSRTRYYLEMPSPADLKPASRPLPPAARVVERPPDSAAIRRVTLAIGAPYGWPSQQWSNAGWAEYLAEPALRHWTLELPEGEAGLVSIRRHDDGSVEIDTFGLTPAFVGRGLGAAFLEAAVRIAWALAPNIPRVWLHTLSTDHPHALRNYEARGFTVYRTEEIPDPDGTARSQGT